MSDAPGRGTGAQQAASALVISLPCTSAAFAEFSAELLRTGVAVRFEAHGGSMSPLVRDGDALWVRPVDPSSIRVGDLLLFTDERCPLVHRVIRRMSALDGIRFMMQGDQVSRPDGVISAAQIYGRVTAIDRAGVRIDVNRPSLRLLGWAAVLRSRWNLRSGQPYRLAARVLRKLPAFSKHLA